MSQLSDEITEQPEVLLRATEKFIDNMVAVDDLVSKINSKKFTNIILTGMGASYYSCYPLWLRLSNLGLPISLWETSELVNFAPNSIRNSTLVIAVSQSGESAEIKKLIEIKEKFGLLVGVTNSNGNYLVQKSDIHLDLSAEGETSVSTKTYLASLAVLHLLGCKIIGKNLNEEIKKIHSIAQIIQKMLHDKNLNNLVIEKFIGTAQHITLFGRGYSLASANYGALIIEEAARFPATGISVPQFRHGPMEIVNPNFIAIMLGGGKNIWVMNQRLVNMIVSLGGRIVVIAPNVEMNKTESVRPWRIHTVDDELLPMLEILPLQQFMISLATSQGIEAGVFKNSGKVTFIE